MTSPPVRIIRASAIAAVLSLGAPFAGAATPTVSVAPPTQGARVGDPFTVTATVANPAARSTTPLTAHLEIIDPTRAGSVDAEDWVPDLNTTIGALAPGEAHDVRWELTPIAGGTFAVYVVALPESAGRVAGPVASSDAIPVDVTEVRTLNAGGALPVPILIPLILVALLVVVRLVARRAEGVVTPGE